MDDIGHTFSVTMNFILFFKRSINLRERERTRQTDNESGKEEQRERERETLAESVLSLEPDARLDITTLKSQPE